MDILFLVFTFGLLAAILGVLLWRTVVTIRRLRAGEPAARTLKLWFRDVLDTFFGLA